MLSCAGNYRVKVDIRDVGFGFSKSMSVLCPFTATLPCTMHSGISVLSVNFSYKPWKWKKRVAFGSGY